MTNQPLDTAALRALAEAATFGPWAWYQNGRILAQIHDLDHPGTRILEVNNTLSNEKDAEFISKFNPPTVLALLDRIEALEAGQLRAVNAAFDQQTEVEYRFYELNVKHANHMADIETHYSQQLQREKDRNAALVAAVLAGHWNEAARLAKGTGE